MDTSPWLAETLRSRSAGSAQGTQVAETLVALLGQIDAALTPFIGQRGVALLYKRAVYLSSLEHPWMVPTQHGINQSLDTGPLQSAMALQPADAALAGGSELLQRLYDLLANLIGLAHTERLLRSVWAMNSSSANAQDTSP